MTTNSERKPKQIGENIKSEYVQKLSNEKALAEAILIANKPCFAVVDFSDPNSSTAIGIMDSLAYNEDTRVKPELLSNRSYSFRNREEFDSYIQKAENETLDSLFDRTLSIWKKYIDADDFHLKICAADTIFTYFQDKIGMTHYLFFVADNDAGKSNNLSVFNILGYRNLMSTSMTYANVYNFLGSKEEGVGTICIDEADTIDQYPELMTILKAGYTKGFPVVRMIDTARGRKQLKLNTYCFKALAAERLPDEVQSKGFMQRTLVLKCLPGYTGLDISEVINPAGDEDFGELLNELNDLRNTLFCYRLLHFKDRIPNIKLNIRNRENQLFKPVLRLFQGTRTFDTLRPVISSYINERRKNKVNSKHAFLYRIVRDLIDSQGSFELESNTIWNSIKMNLQWKEMPHRAQSIETIEFGIMSQKDVIQTLKEIMRAEPGRSNSARNLLFSKDVMDRMKDTYELDISIKVDFVDVTLVTHVTHSEGVGDSNNEVSDSNCHEEIEDNNEGNSTTIHSQKASQASHVSLNQNSYKCPYCEIMYHNSSIAYDNENALDTHVVQKHPRWNAHSQPDIEKFRQEYLSRNSNAKEEKSN